MKRSEFPFVLSSWICLLWGGLFAAAPLALAAEPGFVDLFNGTDLTGWEIVVAEGSSVEGSSIFRAEEGAIHVYPGFEDGSEQPFAGIYTTESYANYHLVVEYKWGEARFAPRQNSVPDAGIVFHLAGEPKVWPDGVECQIQKGDTGDIWIIGQTRVSSSVQPIAFNYDGRGDSLTRGAGMNPQRFPRGYCWETDGWNRVEVIVNEDNAVFKVNGHVVNEALRMRHRDDPNSEWGWQPLKSGRIFLQAEGAEVFYRNISIKQLDQ